MIKTLPSFDPLGDGKSRLELIDKMGDDSTIVRAARVSYVNDEKSFEFEQDTRLIRYLLANRHWSCFEHCYVTFLAECPLPIAVQWLRHKTWNFNMVSRRYTSTDIKFYVPEFRTQSLNNKQASEEFIQSEAISQKIKDITFELEYLYSKSHRVYQSLIEAGVAREQARFALCEGLYTKFYATANLRSIMHWHMQRFSEHSQWEIRQYAECVGKIINELFPITWNLYLELEK